MIETPASRRKWTSELSDSVVDQQAQRRRPTTDARTATATGTYAGTSTGISTGTANISGTGTV